MANRQNRRDKFPPEVNRILYIKNLPYKITTISESSELFDRFESEAHHNDPKQFSRSKPREQKRRRS
ncbi:hypothetical protein B9Z55_021390 [Caenorhabditis nigoni]|nr:hypothetical protein B9Z55_021390 [Caenorhabditis nigoni]